MKPLEKLFRKNIRIKLRILLTMQKINIKNFFIEHFWQMDKSYLGSTFISKRFVGCSFVNDIVVVDDTNCTNRFGFLIIAAIAFDENKASQLIAFGLIQGKSVDDFDQFFCELSKKFSIRVFI